MSAELTQARLRELLHYDPDTGHFSRLKKTNRRVVVGAPAAFTSNGRYPRVSVNNTRYYAHRLAWLYVYGSWPDSGMQIDHIDGDRSNNAIRNLRLASPSLNTQNERRARPQSSSGLLGVHWSAQRGKWRAQIRIAGKQTTLGWFDDREEASAVYLAAKREHHEGCTI